MMPLGSPTQNGPRFLWEEARPHEREPYQFQSMTLERIAEAVLKDGRPISFSRHDCTISFVMSTGIERVINIQRIGQDQFVGRGTAWPEGGSWHWDLADPENHWQGT